MARETLGSAVAVRRAVAVLVGICLATGGGVSVEAGAGQVPHSGRTSSTDGATAKKMQPRNDAPKSRSGSPGPGASSPHAGSGAPPGPKTSRPRARAAEPDRSPHKATPGTADRDTTSSGDSRDRGRTKKKRREDKAANGHQQRRSQLFGRSAPRGETDKADHNRMRGSARDDADGAPNTGYRHVRPPHPVPGPRPGGGVDGPGRGDNLGPHPGPPPEDPEYTAECESEPGKCVITSDDPRHPTEIHIPAEDCGPHYCDGETWLTPDRIPRKDAPRS